MEYSKLEGLKSGTTMVLIGRDERHGICEDMWRGVSPVICPPPTPTPTPTPNHVTTSH